MIAHLHKEIQHGYQIASRVQNCLYQIIEIQRMQMENILTYWCYSCEKYSKQSTEISSCGYCQSEAIELADNNHHDPSTFQPFQIQNESSSNSIHPTPQQTNRNSTTNTLPPSSPPQIMNFGPFQIGFGAGIVNGVQQANVMHMNVNLESMGNFMQSMNQILQSTGLSQLLNSLVGQSNLVPVTAQEVQRLPRIVQVGECTICQQQGGDKQGYKLRCGHQFHIECLTPWFARTNTCPSCRQRI